MDRFSRCILVSDYDETLVDYGYELSRADRDAIGYFTAHGGIFTIATGRSLPTARRRLETVPVNAPILVCNGAVCCRKDGSDVLFCDPLPTDFRAVAQRYTNLYPQLVPEVQSLGCHWTCRCTAERSDWLSGEGAKLLCAGWDAIPQPAVNFVLYAENCDPYKLPANAEVALLLARLGTEIGKLPGYEAVHSAPGMLEVSSVGINKGRAARRLANLLGRDTLICAGDAPNDLSMLQEADYAFVPAGSRLKHSFSETAPCGGAVGDIVEKLETLL